MDLNREIFDRMLLLIGSVGIVISIFFGVFLLVKKNTYSKANIFLSFYLIVFSLRMTKSLFYSYYDVNIIVHNVFLGSLLFVGPSLWFYSLHLEKYSIKKVKYLIHYTPFIAVACFSWLIPYTGRSYFYLGLFAHGLIYCAIMFFALFGKEKKLPEKDNIREINIRKWLFLLIGTTAAMFFNSILIFFEIVPFFPTSSFLFSLSILLLSFYALNHLWIFKSEKVKYSTSNLSIHEVNQYHEKLKRIIEKDQIYLDTELTLTKLSKLVGVSSKQLSQIINQTQNINYSRYIANYRVEEAKRLLENPDYNHYKISAIAYESGFNSISSFNNAFKKITNTTAIKFRESIP